MKIIAFISREGERKIYFIPSFSYRISKTIIHLLDFFMRYGENCELKNQSLFW